MYPERWQQVDAIFQTALDRAPAERAAFLVEACGKDDALRREVEALLSADGKTASLLETPAYAVAAPLMQKAPSSLVGTLLAHYRVLSFVGKGGMGEVYRARDTRLDRTVALKVLPADVAANAERMRRFIREAKAASAVNHPHVATIYEIGEAAGRCFIAMEYVAGQTLAARISDAPLAIREVVEIGSQIADALDEAHRKGITHRDIKPANVMLNERGEVKALDFGLAKIARSQSADHRMNTLADTQPGVVMGTMPYMSPEQALGREVDHRSDIFSLGVLLYEMAAGRTPFAGASSNKTLDRILHAQPEAMARFNDNVPSELERIVRKCLEKDCATRYQVAKELVADLKAFQTGSQEGKAAARMRETNEHAAVLTKKANAAAFGNEVEEAEGRRERALALPASLRYSRAGILGACALLLLGGALGWREFSKFRNAAGKTRRAVQTMHLRRFTASGNIVTATFSPDGKYVATALEEGGLQSLWLKQAAANASGVRLLAPAPVEYWGLTFSHDGNFIYYLSWVRNQSDAELYQMPVLGGTSRRLPIKQLDTPISLAPTGDRFAYVTPSVRKRESYVKMALIDAEVGETLVKREEPGHIATYPGGPAWSPDGQFIAYAATGQTEDHRRPMRVFVVNVRDKSERQLSKQSWAEAGRVAWLGDGSGLVVSAREEQLGPRQLWFVAWPNGDTHKITNDLHDYDSVSLSADGQTLAAVQTQEVFSIAVAPHGKGASLSQANEIYSEVGSGNERLVWTPDQRLLYASRISGNWDIWVMNRNGSGQRQLTVDPHNDTLPAVSADGRYVYFASDRTGAANIWCMEIDGGNATRLTSGTNQFFPEITPDGQWLIYQQGGHSSTEISVWRVPQAGGEPARVNERALTERQSSRPAVSPDGRWLAYVSLDEHGWGVMLRALVSGEAAKRFAFPSNLWRRDIRWAPDGQALAYIVNEKGISNLWLQPVSGAPPRPLTHFKTGRFSVFAWSPDGQWLAYLRPTAMSDVVLLRDFK